MMAQQMQVGQMARETTTQPQQQHQQASNPSAAGLTTPSRLPPRAPPRTPELLGAHLVSALDAAMEDSFDDRRLSIGIPSMDADVDMDIDLDVFRPSAMLDARLEEEFGGSFNYAFNTDNSQRDNEFVDIEHVLLSEVDECAFRLVSQAARSGPLLRSTSLSGKFSAGTTAELPPKYFRTVSASPSKARVHRRTFGERSLPFAFQTDNPMQMKCDWREGAPTSAVTDENRPPSNGHIDVIKVEPTMTRCATPASVRSSGLDEIKHEVLTPYEIQQAPSSLTFSKTSQTSSTVQVGQVGSMLALEESLDALDDDMNGNACTQRADLRIMAPSAAEADAAAARASTLLHHQRMDAMVAGSPLYRRSISSPQQSSSSPNTALLHTPVIPSQQHHQHKVSISPAGTFNKVSVVHAKDTPGKVDKFEWKIRSKATMASLRTDLLACGEETEQSNADSSGVVANTLPPRYFRAVTGSPTKRRVHSTTFGAFARSFSFNATA